ncbi:hypothetical protein EIP86_001333 [Pleurotus ostreatoroseus]|nr:hypothetical protein EIP86_001333 [Pleurotus ostreatoroseus]
MHNPLLPRYRVARRYQHFHLDSRDPDALDTPQAGPSRISPRDRAQDLYSDDDDDAQSTPKILTRPSPPTDGPSRAHPWAFAQAAETPAERLRGALKLAPSSNTTASSYRHAIPPTPSDHEPESDFDIPNFTAPSIARESLRSIFASALDDTPRKERQRRNSIDLSEVEDSPRVQSVVRERAKIKGKRKSMSDEEAEKISKSFEKSPGLRSSAATFIALQEKLQSSTSAPTPRPTSEVVRMPERMQRGFSLQQFINSQAAEETESQSDQEPEASGDTATIARHFTQRVAETDASLRLPTATPMTLKSFQMPSQIQMQSNLMDQDSTFQQDMQRLDSSYEGASRTTQREAAAPPSPAPVDVSSVSFPMSRPGDSASPPHSFSKARRPQGIPIPRRTSGASSRSSSLSATEFQDRVYETEREKLLERERQWNKPIAGSPSTPERTRRPSGGSPSFNTTIRPSPRTFTRRVSGSSIQSVDDGRSSRASSISSRVDYRETEAELMKERERMWNKPQRRLSRSSSSMSLNSSSDRAGLINMPTRPDSAQSYNRSRDSRPSSWHSASPRGSVDMRPDPADKEAWVAWERERNWRSPNPKWEIQPPREMSPLPEPPEGGPSPYAYHGLPKDSPLHPANHASKFVIPKYPPLSPSPARTRSRTQSVPEQPSGKLYSPLRREGTDSRIPVSRARTPSSRSSSGGYEGEFGGPSNAQTVGYVSRYGWSPQNYHGTGSARKSAPVDDEDEEEEPLPQAPMSKIPALSIVKKNSLAPPRPTSLFDQHQRVEEMQSLLRPRARNSLNYASVNGKGAAQGHRRASAEFAASEFAGYPSGRVNPEPIEVSTEVEADPDVESDAESHVTSATEPTPIARPAPLPPPLEEVEEVESEAESRPPSPPHTPPLAQSTPREREEVSVDSEQFYSMAAPPPAHTRTPSPPRSLPHELARREPDYSLQTPPRWASSSSKADFETPSPPRGMPAPPSSEDDTEEGRTPVGNPFAGAANLTDIKTPKPPGGWDTTPMPALRTMRLEAAQPARSTSPPGPPPGPVAIEAATPEAAQLSESVVAPTPAPPGGWLPTPAASMRRKSILKVRFDVDPNTSGESLASVPMVGPNDSISEIFPPVDPTPRKEKEQEREKGKGRDKGKGRELSEGEKENQERPSTPPTVRAKPRAPRSPGLRMVDAYGRDIVEEDTPEEPQPQPKPASKSRKERSSSSSIVTRKRPPPTPMRMVDAMGREITEVSIEDSEHSETYDLPVSRTEALARVKKSLASLVDELGDSDTSRELFPRNEQRINDLYNASNAARVARKSIKESLQKHKSVDDDLRAKYGSLRESMNKNKLLPPAASPRRYSINFLNGWVLWVLLIIQIFVVIYMYHLSTIRAKHIFLTTYYDAFHPDLFLHLTKHRAIPSTASWSLSVISETLIRTGWRGLMSEMWGNVTLLVDDVRNNLWTVWGQQRTPVWPPT